MDANDWFFDLDPNNWIFEVDPKILIGPDPDRFTKSIFLFFYQSLFIIYYFQKSHSYRNTYQRQFEYY